MATAFPALAQALGVSRQSLWRWRNDPRIARKLPRKSPVGHDVAAWRRVMIDLTLADCAADLPGHDGKSLNDLRCELLAQRVRRLKVQNDIASGKAVPVAEIEQKLGAMLSAVQMALDTFADRAAPLVQGFTDPQEIAKALRGEMQSLIGGLELCDFENAVADVPEANRGAVLAELRRIGGWKWN